jgi:ATP-dependent DNA ligase
MLCEKGIWSQFPNDGKHIFEPKLDGIRVLASKQEQAVKLVGRSGEDYTAKFPEVVKDLLKLPSGFANFISDGELCAANGDFRSIAGRVHLKDGFRIELNAKVNPAVYYIFDLLSLNGGYLVKRPLRERKQLLETLGEQEHVKIVKPQPLDELIKLVEAQKIEGVVAKNLDSTYELRRSPSWIKFRPAEGFDLPIIGYEESDKPDRPFRSLILIWKGRELQASSGLANDDLHYALEKFSAAKIVRTTREAGRNKRYFESPVGEAEIVFTSTPNLPVRFPRVLKLKFDR